MNPRHAAALALVGWYLMIPPKIEGWYFKDWHFFNGVRADERAPLDNWKILKSFDSAGECEAYRSTIRKFEASSSDADYMKKRAELSLCIATDDPRLKGN